MLKPRIGVMYAPGTNCHEETAFTVELAGGEARMVLLADLLAGRSSLADLQGLIFPGGFSFGDHLAAGRIFAVHLMARLGDDLRTFLGKGRPVLGICNGDQVLMETGLLPGGSLGAHDGALTQNRSARFEGRWVTLAAAAGTFWTEGLAGRVLRFPTGHGEGRLLRLPHASVKPAFHYLDGQGRPTEAYPANPSGSPGGLAGLTDGSGLVLGLMPHPERAVLSWHGSTDGLALFRNMVGYCAQG